ncbi:MAG: hypothetical protein UR68_C0008G0011 [Candidatus Roizmanbacteria bacterium GW2011_GWA2_35_19]|uniref:Glycosyltransferase RgtA/B/C/D-like domain-containing protein n=2 Tax=Candidatus Roizmaniibacteriota TaxID=1752723 RepID=A0A0G0ED24_9BACT|nr:MAG: hypothetical protein UR63_C0011G0012 [Candidatus Roizmanbacteria bacterium GW2011_GWC2_35_12]KKP73100.1 MAG: hypothetical protein UR68_C0008G0011 [Candidatus Roizmanbacteria bacterium GW2011_GWA2_35_19]
MVKIKKIFLLFIIWRVVDFLIIYFAPRFIPYLGFFPYREQLVTLHKPIFLTPLANFDGINYIVIATQQYHQYIQAFFPLYPTLIRLLLPIFKDGLVAGLIVSNVSFLVGLYVFYKYLKLTMVNFSRLQSKLIILFILAFPTSFFFGAVYTEGLFFLLLISTLYFLKKESYFLVGFFAILASLTRFVGVFLVIPIIFHWLSKSFRGISHLAETEKSSDKRERNPRFAGFLTRLIVGFEMTWKVIIITLSPLFGLGLYCFYLWKTTGDPLFFLNVQPVFGANRSTQLILLPQVIWRYLKIFFTASWNFQYFISAIEFLFFSFVFIILVFDLLKHFKFISNFKFQIKNFDRLGLSLFSFANIILPTLTGTLSSIPRYSLFSISVFIFLSEIKNNLLKTLIIIIFLILHIVLFGFFRQGYFIS